MSLDILDYICENKLPLTEFLYPSEVLRLEQVNMLIRNNIPANYWCDIIKKLYNAESIIENDKYFLIIISDTHKINSNIIYLCFFNYKKHIITLFINNVNKYLNIRAY